MELQIIKEQKVLNKDFKMYGTVQEPLFLAEDVANWIEHSNSRMMLKKVDDDEKIKVKFSSVNNAYGRESNLISEKWFLTEQGLYEVLMQSRKPIAKQFKKEVKKILKTIRLTGGYVANEDMFINIYLPHADEQTKNLFKLNLQTITQLNNIIDKQQPLVNFANTVQGTNKTILVRQCSKLAQNYIGVDIGEKKLYQKLREWGLICKSHNEPTQLGKKMKLFEYIERTINKNGYSDVVYTTKITPKGQVYIINRLIKENNKEVSA